MEVGDLKTIGGRQMMCMEQRKGKETCICRSTQFLGVDYYRTKFLAPKISPVKVGDIIQIDWESYGFREMGLAAFDILGKPYTPQCYQGNNITGLHIPPLLTLFTKYEVTVVKEVEIVEGKASWKERIDGSARTEEAVNQAAN